MSHISKVTENLTADFLNRLAKADARTENNRLNLAHNLDQTVEKAFNRLDKRGFSNVTWTDLQEYFQCHQQHISTDEARLLERIINQNCEGRISFNTFKDYMLPQTEVDLRSRLNCRVSYSPLDHSTNNSLFQLLSAELSNSLESLKTLQETKNRVDYDAQELQRLIDSQNYGFIDTTSLDRFLRRNNHQLNEVDLEGILYRLGHRHTGKVSYNEFAHALSSVYGSYYAQVKSTYSSPTKESFVGDISPKKQDYLSESVRYSSQKLEDARRDLDETLNRSNARRSFQNTPVRDYSLARNLSFVDRDSTIKSSHKLLYSDELEWTRLITEVIRLDNRVEESRIRLSNCDDFNLSDGWHHFCRPDRSWIDIADIQTGLDRLGVYRSQAEIETIIKRVTRGNTSLNYAQFCNLVAPRDRYQAEKVNSRRTNQGHYLASYTRTAFADLLKTIIDNEVSIQKSKDTLRYRVGWNNMDAWNTINKLNVSRVNAEDFRIVLRDAGYTASAAEIERLMERYPTQDVFYSDFVEEIESRWR